MMARVIYEAGDRAVMAKSLEDYDLTKGLGVVVTEVDLGDSSMPYKVRLVEGNQSFWVGAADITDQPAAIPTLRDQLAMAALTGLLSAEAVYGGKTDPRDLVATDAYAHADAMLAAREAK